METLHFLATLVFCGWALYLVFNRSDMRGEADKDHGVYRYEFYYKSDNQQIDSDDDESTVD